jgi:Integrase core domain
VYLVVVEGCLLWSLVYLVVRNLFALVWLLLRSPRSKELEILADPILVIGRRHLLRVLAAYVAHYNEHRPHRALHQRPPLHALPPTCEAVDLDRVRRRDLLGGLIHEYRLAA